jgi:hypothetical protein
VQTITGLFAVNRRGGALWAIAEEPGAAHVVGRSRDMGALFFEEVLPMRVGSGMSSTGLKPLDEKAGFIGDPKARTFQAASAPGAPAYPTAWLPTERAARAWQAVVTGQPLDK